MKDLMKILRETLSYVYIQYDIEKMYLEQNEMKLDDTRDDREIEYYRRNISDLNMKFIKYRKYIQEIPKIIDMISNKISQRIVIYRISALIIKNDTYNERNCNISIHRRIMGEDQSKINPNINPKEINALIDRINGTIMDIDRYIANKNYRYYYDDGLGVRYTSHDVFLCIVCAYLYQLYYGSCFIPIMMGLYITIYDSFSYSYSMIMMGIISIIGYKYMLTSVANVE